MWKLILYPFHIHNHIPFRPVSIFVPLYIISNILISAVKFLYLARDRESLDFILYLAGDRKSLVFY